MPQAVVVIPCFNEERRLDGDAALSLCDEETQVLFVDDGSRDGTRALLESLAARSSGRASVLALERNGGKGEAVRSGLLEAIARGAQIVGYADADLSTPVPELKRLLDVARREGALVVLGSRVQLLGRSIERTPARHYLGRIFATAASLALDLRVYDTQCGAKFFRATPRLTASLSRPFTSRWAFDVELLGRLLSSKGAGERYRAEDLVEVPLQAWRDVGGSKLSTKGALRAGLDLARIAGKLRSGR